MAETRVAIEAAVHRCMNEKRTFTGYDIAALLGINYDAEARDVIMTAVLSGENWRNYRTEWRDYAKPGGDIMGARTFVYVKAGDEYIYDRKVRKVPKSWDKVLVK